MFSKISPSLWVLNLNPSHPLKLHKSAKNTTQLHHLGAASLGIGKGIEEKSNIWCWAYPTWFFPGFRPMHILSLHYLGSSPMPSRSYMYFILCSFFFFFLFQAGMTALKQMIMSFPEIKTPLKILVLDLRFLNQFGRVIFVCFRFCFVLPQGRVTSYQVYGIQKREYWPTHATRDHLG